MKINKLTLAAVPFFLLSGCSSTPAPDTTQLTEEARKAAGGLMQTLSGELKTALTTGGPANAIVVCKERAPLMASEASQRSGMQISRVSPKNRNSKSVPDAWETKAQASLEKRLAAGEKPEMLDLHEVVTSAEGKVFRYAKALVMQPMCISCHGALDTLSPEVKTRLATEYPNDKAIGYAAGVVRGIISIKKTL